MTKRIFFGSVQIYNLKTKESKSVPNIVYLEGTNLDDRRNYILNSIPPEERQNYTILYFNTSTAETIGIQTART